jgi:hypothetical protein
MTFTKNLWSSTLGCFFQRLTDLGGTPSASAVSVLERPATRRAANSLTLLA